MFSTGQLVFASLFLIVFTFVIIKSYRKDRNLHRKNYNGVVWVGTVFVIFIILLFVLKQILKN